MQCKMPVFLVEFSFAAEQLPVRIVEPCVSAGVDDGVGHHGEVDHYFTHIMQYHHEHWGPGLVEQSL